MRRGSKLGALFVTLACAACGESVGVAEDAYCRGYYVTRVAARDGVVFFVSPDHLLQSTEGWGPQTLALSIEKDVAVEISFENAPSVSRERNKITQSVQASIGFSLTHEIDLIASNAVLVPTDAYYRVEAYPQYQVVDFDLRREACGPMVDALLTRGSVYRPIGVYFRTMIFVGGAWNALAPPSPSQIAVPPSLTRVSDADAGAGR